jgi:hypothetical protein
MDELVVIGLENIPMAGSKVGEHLSPILLHHHLQLFKGLRINVREAGPMHLHLPKYLITSDREAGVVGITLLLSIHSLGHQ